MGSRNCNMRTKKSILSRWKNVMMDPTKAKSKDGAIYCCDGG